MSAASPDMDSDEALALRDSIKTLGQLVPIVMWRGEVIDGRKRLAACRALGIEPLMVSIPDDVTATDYAGALNLLRTHYTVGQRAMYAAALATAPRGFRPDRDRSDTANLGYLTTTEAARAAGASVPNVERAKRVRRVGAREVAASVERGEISLHAAHQIVQNHPREQQAAVVAKVIGQKGQAKRLKPGTLTPTAKYKALPKRNAAVVIGKCLANIEAACDVLEQYGANVPVNGERKQWLVSLDTITGTLRRFRRRLTVEVADEG